ncbi:MAG: hypothetical protein JRN42_07155 [Nitrososphaerota archaeon]|nr:hypothetical protein [Nitrososphaerota archaeon]
MDWLDILFKAPSLFEATDALLGEVWSSAGESEDMAVMAMDVERILEERCGRDQRRVAFLRWRCGCRFADVAMMLGMSEGAVRDARDEVVRQVIRELRRQRRAAATRHS